MTTGSYVIDRRYSESFIGISDCLEPPSTYNYTLSNLGTYETRSWSGGNNPVAAPVQRDSASFTYTVYGTRRESYWEAYSVKVRDSSGRVIGTKTKKRRRTRLVPTSKTRTFNYPAKKRKREVSLEDHGYTVTWYYEQAVPVKSTNLTVKCTNGSQIYGWFSSADLGNPPPLILDNNTKIKVLTRLRESVQGEAFNLAVSVAEAKQSLGTIGNSCEKLVRAINFLGNGNVAKAATTLLGSKPPLSRPQNIRKKDVTEKWFASNWLELQYGWLPLISDVSAAASHLAHTLNRPVTKRYRASASVKRSGNLSPGPTYSHLGEMVARRSVVAKVRHINEASLVGLTDPASLIWEKLPYSFVADWVIPVGSYLSARALGTALEGTFITTDVLKMSVTGISNLKGSLYSYSPQGTIVRRSGSMLRSISSSLDVPLPRVKSLGEMASWKHAVSSIALLVNAFPKVSAAWRNSTPTE